MYDDEGVAKYSASAAISSSLFVGVSFKLKKNFRAGRIYLPLLCKGTGTPLNAPIFVLQYSLACSSFPVSWEAKSPGAIAFTLTGIPLRAKSVDIICVKWEAPALLGVYAYCAFEFNQY